MNAITTESYPEPTETTENPLYGDPSWDTVNRDESSILINPRKPATH